MALISKEDLLTKFETGALLFQPEVKRIIKIQPEVDAVPVVRCKDCEYYTEEERWCRRLGLCGAFDQNDYCSHAERRTDATLNRC